MSARNPYIDVYFGTGQCISTTSEVWQYDHGLKLRIHGFASANVPQIQYSNAGLADAMSVASAKESNCIVADIPDVLLTQSKEIQCYAYVENSSSGITVYEIHIPIRPRSKPKDISFTPQQIDSYGKLTSELNAAIDEVKDIKSNLGTVTNNAKSATSDANAATAEAESILKKLRTINLEVKSLSALSPPSGSVKQTESSTTLSIGIPVSDFAYATFEVDPLDGCLYMNSPDSLKEVTFNLNNNGELCVTV